MPLAICVPDLPPAVPLYRRAFEALSKSFAETDLGQVTKLFETLMPGHRCQYPIRTSILQVSVLLSLKLICRKCSAHP